MKILARLLGFTAIGLLFIGMLMNIMQENILLRDLVDMTSLAVNQTQIVMKEQIEDQYYNYENARTYFTTNDEYYDYFKDCFAKLITSNAKYEAELYDIDFTKGLISVGVDCKYKNIIGNDKVLHTRKTSIVDVLLNADVSESIIPDVDLIITQPPSITLANFNYDGAEHILSNPGACSGGTFYYGYSDSSTKQPTNYTTQLPKGVDAGTYCVWFKVKSAKTGNFEHETFIGTSVIKPREVTINWGTDSWIYSGEDHSIDVSIGNTIATDNVSVNFINNSIKNVGTKNVVITEITNSNYVLPEENLSHEIEITPATANVYMYEYRMKYSETMPYRYAEGEAPEDNVGDITYDEREHRINGFSYYITGLIGGDSLSGIPTYTINSFLGGEITDLTTAIVGTYNVTMSGLSNSNYLINYNPTTLKINKQTNYLIVPELLNSTMVQGEGTCTISTSYDGIVNNYYGTLTYELLSAVDESGNDVISKLGTFIHTDSIKFVNINPNLYGLFTIRIKAHCSGDSNHDEADGYINVQMRIYKVT